MPEPSPNRTPQLRHERRRQLRTLILLALAAILLTLLRAYPQGLFHPGWWRL